MRDGGEEQAGGTEDEEEGVAVRDGQQGDGGWR